MKILKFFSLVYESLVFAAGALRENLLRTTLSLLGVTIGIFSIISVYTAVDSLETSVKSSLAFIKSDVIFVQKWPWAFSPDYPWWKYVNRPQASFNEFRFLKEHMTQASSVSIYAATGGVTMKQGSNSFVGVLIGHSFEYNQANNFKIAEGRYFTQTESDNGLPLGIIGHEIAETLFPGRSPINQYFTCKGRKVKIIGVLKKEGESIINIYPGDQICYTTFGFFSSLYNTKSASSEISVALTPWPEDTKMEKLEADVRNLMRARRGLKPVQEDNFALNKPELFTAFLNNIFIALKGAGTIIGLFSILVGGFGIANIMFVSVRDRTSIIGIQKSLGAKNYFILCQFLFEAIFLCLLGGLVGLGMVWVLTWLIAEFEWVSGLSFVLSQQNVVVALVISTFIGVVAGLVPAIVAARMDPVEAIRAK